MYWKFVHQCTVAARAMGRNEAVKAILRLQQNQDRIAKRLGDKEFEEWTFHRQGRLRENKPVTFQTFCDWIETKAATLQACESAKHLQPREHIKQSQSRVLNPDSREFHPVSQNLPRENVQRRTYSQVTQSQEQRSEQAFITSVRGNSAGQTQQRAAQRQDQGEWRNVPSTGRKHNDRPTETQTA